MPCTNAAGQFGLSGNGMGIGQLGAGTTMLKRKFRYIFTIYTCNSKAVPPYFVKTSSRPKLTIEETEINFLNAKTWIPGKAAWESITVTYYDVATSDNIELFSWLASVYDFTDPTCLHMNSKRSEYVGSAILWLLDGCGNPIESWIMGDMWPTSINFGDLDYASSDTVDIELTLRYSQVEYNNFCGGVIQRCDCTPCV